MEYAGLIIALISNFIALLVFVWKVAEWKSELQSSINQNKKDIDNLAHTLRCEIRSRDKHILIKLNSVIEYIESKTDFRSPRMTDDD